MSLKLVLLCSFVALSAGKDLPLEVSSTDAALGQVPYQVTLYKKSTIFTNENDGPYIFGGGAILNEQWILTLSPNIFYTSADQIAVIAANIHRRQQSNFEQIINVSSVFLHPSHSDPFNSNGIALLKLETPLKFNEYVQPIDLPQPNSRPSGSGVIAGIGSMMRLPISVRSDTLQVVTMPIISQDECRKLHDASFKNHAEFKTFDDDVAFCTGPTEINQVHCLDFAGNPFVTEENGKKVVSGIAVFALTSACYTPSTPSLFVSVHSSSDWIRKTIST